MGCINKFLFVADNPYNQKNETQSQLHDAVAALAEGSPGEHIHYDEHNAPDEGSAEMIIEIIR